MGRGRMIAGASWSFCSALGSGINLDKGLRLEGIEQDSWCTLWVHRSEYLHKCVHGGTCTHTCWINKALQSKTTEWYLQKRSDLQSWEAKDLALYPGSLCTIQTQEALLRLRGTQLLSNKLWGSLSVSDLICSLPRWTSTSRRFHTPRALGHSESKSQGVMAGIMPEGETVTGLQVWSDPEQESAHTLQDWGYSRRLDGFTFFLSIVSRHLFLLHVDSCYPHFKGDNSRGHSTKTRIQEPVT